MQSELNVMRTEMQNVKTEHRKTVIEVERKSGEHMQQQLQELRDMLKKVCSMHSSRLTCSDCFITCSPYFPCARSASPRVYYALNTRLIRSHSFTTCSLRSHHLMMLLLCTYQLPDPLLSSHCATALLLAYLTVALQAHGEAHESQQELHSFRTQQRQDSLDCKDKQTQQDVHELREQLSTSQSQLHTLTTKLHSAKTLLRTTRHLRSPRCALILLVSCSLSLVLLISSM